ncbi:MAG TPA: S41 family peptidase [Burkholderiaceae bacterium]|nr:S41 family peptidase [Burkholderiaceae bacterium]
MKSRRASSAWARVGRWLARGGSATLLALVVACGGYSNDTVSCDVVSRQSGLHDYFFDWYFWYALSPFPLPGTQPTLDAYFDSLLYTGTDPNFPADRWSFHQSTNSFANYFGFAQTLGYGLAVAGLEVTTPTPQPAAPLWVRYVESQSPAAAAGVVRGDQVVSVNGRLASDMIAANDFSVFTPAAAGDTIHVVLANGGVQRNVDIVASVFALTPVPTATVVTSPGGRKMGYLVVKDMLDQAADPLAAAFATFTSQGVEELVLDLRYNGGGFVSVGRLLASYVNPGLTAGQTYAALRYSDKRSDQNTTYVFRTPGSALALTRVYVLQGPRTCSAAEQVVNALKPFVDVVQIGDTSCGKPLGFQPVDDGCGETYAVINFETVNASNQGRYFDGLAPQCVVAEDFGKPLGALDEPLLATARNDADGIACPAVPASTRQRPLGALQRQRALSVEGERPAMIAR